MVLLMLVGVHLLVLLVLRMGVHFVMLLVLPMRVHLVVLWMGLHLVAGGVRQHRLEQMWWLTRLIGGRVHQGRSSLRLGMLLLDLRCFPWIRDFCMLLWLLLELHLGVWWYLRV